MNHQKVPDRDEGMPVLADSYKQKLKARAAKVEEDEWRLFKHTLDSAMELMLVGPEEVFETLAMEYIGILGRDYKVSNKGPSNDF